MFQFEKSRSPLFGHIFRPVAQVFLYSERKKKWYETWMIVDTGADYTILPRYFSSRLKIDLKHDCAMFRTAGIGGTERVYLLKRMKVRLGSWERIVPVGFLDRDDIPPLLGRHLFFETFEAHFSSHHALTFTTP